MRSRIAIFPGGAAGAGLLLLRLSVAASALILIGCDRFSNDVQILCILLAGGICAGLQTRVLAGLSLGVSLLDSASLGLPLIHAISAMALVLTGPGAFSVDARLFGRRTITLADSEDTNV
jgi:hypothetical protein